MPDEQGNNTSGIKWNEVTWYSRLGAVVFFVGVIPALSFYIGTQYEIVTSTLQPTVAITSEVSTPVTAILSDAVAMQTYSYPQLGFQIQLPKGWFSQEISDDGSSRFQSTDFDHNGHGIGIPDVGNMWVYIAKGICNDPTADFVDEQQPDISEKTICTRGFQITLGLWTNDPQRVQHEQTLETVVGTFTMIATTTTASTTWSKLIPTIRPVLKTTYSAMNNGGLSVEQKHPIYVIQEVTLADGTAEALLDLGDGGAATDNVTVMRMNDGQPFVALFKDAIGQPHVLNALVGDVVGFGSDVTILASQDAVITGGWTKIDDQGNPIPISCTVTAYRWNVAYKMFVLDPALGTQVEPRFCQVAKARSESSYSGPQAFQL